MWKNIMRKYEYYHTSADAIILKVDDDDVLNMEVNDVQSRMGNPISQSLFLNCREMSFVS